MPFIDSKVTVKLSSEEKELLKTKLGNIITKIPGKSENYLMIGFQDEYSLYFRGEELKYGAFVEVKIFGETSKSDLEKVTKEICDLYEKELNIPKDAIYIKYEQVENWGFNGFNF
ncbi:MULTISPECIES: phenylpyruvate tautomerase MIF-related protein [Clostridium]|uniref:phenylpyruvate tautomerase MIF-related protein n=1 Tax=Clostridium TaxID=1485 RepID=UPI00189A512C|nr:MULTISPECIES: phenylpyruvate tautomerase MIF-related protein [Clostridium]MCR1952608.1 phenylpyruvate tautomerase MIF-related protein [Clostridium sp. DSM 100503]MDI9215391.1 phenylpyruvate tautomerase MIF-related protein [Clostridium tertium]